MKRFRLGFTLVEMLIVLAIIAILAAMVFPVFSQVKGAAKRAVCFQNHRSVYLGFTMYLSDYDDTFPIANYAPTVSNSRVDRTWVQMILPYVPAFGVFRDPADDGRRPPTELSFDQDLVPGDVTTQYYNASIRSNIGYNYLYLSPTEKVGAAWKAEPKKTTQLDDQVGSLLFVDTVYGRGSDGQPEGGGSYLVIPPCRYSTSGLMKVDTFFQSDPGGNHTVFAANIGWSSKPESPYKYGLAWPWHNGKVMVTRLSGKIVTMQLNELTRGCNVQDNWTGLIDDPTNYIWDTK